MIKYAKLINKQTGLCNIGIGTNVEFYKSIGMELLDVQQSDIDNNWYLIEKCPTKTNEDKIHKRENDFKSLFFEIEGLGWLRRIPKGYNSAVESVNTAFNIVSIMQKLPANIMTFYKAPDFTKEEQCTEEWLIENSFKNEEMTVEQFAQFYTQFMTAWNNQEHIN